MALGFGFFLGLLSLFISGFATMIMFFSLTPAWNGFSNIVLGSFGNLGNITQMIQQDNLIWFSGFTFMITGLVLLAYILTYRDEPAEYSF